MPAFVFLSYNFIVDAEQTDAAVRSLLNLRRYIGVQTLSSRVSASDEVPLKILQMHGSRCRADKYQRQKSPGHYI